MSPVHNGIQYLGLPGITQECLDGLMRLLQYNDKIDRARILSAADGNTTVHGFLLTVQPGDLVAIKSGFASGYSGEGSRKFSYALMLLEAHKVDIDEFDVGEAVLGRLDRSSLTEADIDAIDAMRPVRPSRYHDYIDDRHYEWLKDGTLWRELRPVVPLSLIDSRVADLAMTFWDNPDDSLMKGYRRLEDAVRKRAGLLEHGAKLFRQAFNASAPKLKWKEVGNDEQAARADLFASVYSAHRNPRAHKEPDTYSANQLLSEFLLLNHLYRLEREATEE